MFKPYCVTKHRSQTCVGNVRMISMARLASIHGWIEDFWRFGDAVGSVKDLVTTCNTQALKLRLHEWIPFTEGFIHYGFQPKPVCAHWCLLRGAAATTLIAQEGTQGEFAGELVSECLRLDRST